MIKTRPLLLVLGATLALSACVEDVYFYTSTQGSGSTGTGSAPTCTPAVTRPCYDGTPGTEGVGTCKAGTQTCAADGASWGACVGEVVPQPADCASGMDLHCDGKAATCAGMLVWAKRFGNVNGEYDQSVAVDSAGNVYLAGFFDGAVDFGGGTLTSQGAGDIFVVKLDPNGQHVWSKRFGNTSSEFARSIAVDPQGNVLVTGSFTGTIDFGGGLLSSPGGGDIFVVKLDPNGQHLWSKSFGDAETQQGTGVTSDTTGAVLLTGFFLGAVDFGGGSLHSAGGQEVFVAKFDATGQHVWSIQSGGDIGAQQGTQPSVSIASDSTNSLVVGGSFVSPLNFGGGPLPNGGGFDVFLAKLDMSGQHVWSKSYGAVGDQQAANVAMDAMGNVLVTGGFEGTVDFGGGPLTSTSAGLTDVFVTKVAPDGQPIWSQRFGEAGGQAGLGISSDSLGNAVFTGDFGGSINFGDNPLASAGATDAFVAKRDPSGGALWSKRFGDAGGQIGTRLTTDAAGNVLVTGFCGGGTVDFGAGPVPGSGGIDIFIAKFGP